MNTIKMFLADFFSNAIKLLDRTKGLKTGKGYTIVGIVPRKFHAKYMILMVMR